MELSVDVILNAAAGSTANETADTIERQFREGGIEAHIHEMRDDTDVEQFVRGVAAGNKDGLVAAGGDGTVSLTAAAATDTGRSLGVLPLGTLNNFSKDVGIPQTLDGAIDVIIAGETAVIDLAEVNGQTFVNNSSIGLYPRIVRHREKQQRLGRGKWFAAFWAAFKAVRFSHFLRIQLVIDGKEYRRKTPFVFVGNNVYDMDLYNIGRRPRLDEGKLSVYFLKRGGRWGVIVMLFKTITGGLRQWEDFEEIHTDRITILSRKKRLSVALDGEVKILQTPLTYRTRPKALTVLVPASTPAVQ